jgi:hypothetical protein
MGLMMWFMMRQGKEPTPPKVQETPERVRPVETPTQNVSAPAPSSPFKAIVDCMQMCLNWKVLLGLAAVALLVGVVAPYLLLGALPVLLVLACPLSMLFMTARMRGSMQTTTSHCAACDPQEEQASVSMDEERLACLNTEQETSERTEGATSEIPVLAEAQAVAQAATQRQWSRDRRS